MPKDLFVKNKKGGIALSLLLVSNLFMCFYSPKTVESKTGSYPAGTAIGKVTTSYIPVTPLKTSLAIPSNKPLVAPTTAPSSELTSPMAFGSSNTAVATSSNPLPSFVIGFPEPSANALTLVNTINTVEGGTHIAGFKTALTRVINDYAKKKAIIKGESLMGDDVREGITAIVSLKIPQPQFEGQTKTKLGNSEIKGYVDSVVTSCLSEIFEENPQVARKIALKAADAIYATDDGKAIKAARFLKVPFIISPKIIVDLYRLQKISLKKARKSIEKLGKIGRYSPEIIAESILSLTEARNGKTHNNKDT